MDRDELITKLTTVELGYLALQTIIKTLEERLKKLEESARGWDIWYAKLAMLPVVASFALVILSAAISVRTTQRTDAMIQAAERILAAIPKAN